MNQEPMKGRILLILALILILLMITVNLSAQWTASPYKQTVKVCSAYKYGKFSGLNGKTPKFVRNDKFYKKAIRRRARFATNKQL